MAITTQTKKIDHSGMTIVAAALEVDDLTLGDDQTIAGTLTAQSTVDITGGDTNITTTSASTSGSTSVEPLLVSTTMTGAGGVGGRARFYMTTNVALAGWSNALKGEVTYGASGKTTGLGSAILAEMTLSAGTNAGTYAPIEVELNLGSGALTGTNTSLMYLSVNGADAATFDTNGYLFTLAGVTAAANKMFAATGGAVDANELTHGLRVKIAGSDYYIPLATAANFAD